jgi:hypothetical protein
MTNRLVDPLLLDRPLAFEWPPQESERTHYAVPARRGKRRASTVSALLVMLVAALVMVPAALADDDDDDGDDDGPSCIVGSASGDFGTMFAGADQRLVFTACDNGPSAADTGSATYTNFTAEPDFGYTATLVCVSVAGNTARFGYVIPGGTTMPHLEGWNVVWQVTDVGPNGQGDMAGWIAAPPPTTLAQTCDAAAVPQQAITSGDIVVQQGGGGGDGDDDGDDDDD